MKKSLYAIVSLLTIMMFASCEKDLMDFEGETSIYFNLRSGAAHLDSLKWPHKYSSEVSFGSMVQNDYEITIPVCVTGTPVNYDRPFSIEVVNDSTTAKAGAEFDAVNTEHVIKAGELSTNVKIKFHRTAAIDGDTLRLQIRLKQNQHFNTKFQNYEEDGYQHQYLHRQFDNNHDATCHTIYIYDVLSRPEGWAGLNETGLGTFGAFSPTKYRLIMQLTGTNVNDFLKVNMPSARQAAIGETLGLYLLEKAKDRSTVVLDEDGTMMYCNAVGTLGGSSAWRPFTKPEDYFHE